MKRSEMLDTLLELMTDWDVINMATSEYILAGLEKKGMLPPFKHDIDKDSCAEIFSWSDE